MNRLDATRYPMRLTCGGARCKGHRVMLDVDELARDHPLAFAGFQSLRLTDVDSREGRDRIALAQAYADSDRAWELAGDELARAGLRITGLVISQTRNADAVKRAVLALSRTAPEGGLDAPEHDALSRLLALASVHEIEVLS